MREMIALVAFVLCFGFAFEATAEQSRYSKAVQKPVWLITKNIAESTA